MTGISERPKEDMFGAYTNCAFYVGALRTDCSALRSWYNKNPGSFCYRCPFFKTKERVAKENEKSGRGLDFARRNL